MEGKNGGKRKVSRTRKTVKSKGRLLEGKRGGKRKNTEKRRYE